MVHSRHVKEQMRLQAVEREEAAKRHFAVEEMRAKLAEKKLLEAQLQDALEAQQRKLDDALGEAAALRVDRETIQSEVQREQEEKRRRDKQENAEERRKLEEAVAQKRKGSGAFTETKGAR